MEKVSIKNILKKYKISIIIVFIFSIFYSLLYVISPKILSLATNRLVDSIKYINNNDIKYIINILLICLTIYFITNFIKYINSIIINKICNKVAYELRNTITNKINNIKLSYYDIYNEGDILSRINNDITNITDSLEDLLNEVISSTISFIGIFIMMFSISIKLTIISILLIPTQLVLMAVVMSKTQKYFDKKQNIISNFNNVVLNTITNHNHIKLNNITNKEYLKFKKNNNDLYKYSYKSDFLSSLILPIISLINNLGYIIISIFGGIFAIRGKIKIGDIQAFIQYISNFNEKSETVGGLSISIQTMNASVKHLNEFLILEDEDLISGDVLNNIKGYIEFENVNFSYNTSNNLILKNINFKINKGETIAIVGHTGCGKTTITNLLLKYYTNYSGKILIDGKDIKKIKTSYLRNKIGIILQNNWVFSDNIKENILMGNNDNKFNIINKEFDLEKYIKFNTIINEENNNISSGEKQIISIFRTLTNKYDIIIMDEATSNIDSRTDILIQNLINKTIKNKTAIIIAHKLNTIKNADKIIVMDKGKIVEVGTHDELVSLNKVYKKLYDNAC